MTLSAIRHVTESASINHLSWCEFSASALAHAQGSDVYAVVYTTRTRLSGHNSTDYVK